MKLAVRITVAANIDLLHSVILLNSTTAPVYQAAVADSLMDTAGISEFVNAHRTLMNTELAETSTDQLLSNFLQDRSEGLATPNLRGDRSPSGAQRRIDAGDVLDGDEYSDDDFEEFEDDNTVPQVRACSRLPYARQPVSSKTIVYLCR
jgi:hypothetical protein